MIEPKLWRLMLKDVTDTLSADGSFFFSNPATPGLGIHYSEQLDELVDWIVRQGPKLINLRPDRALHRSPPGKVVIESDLFSEWDLFGASDVVEPYSGRSNRDQISASCGCVALRKCVPNGALICTNYNLVKLVARAA